MSKSTSSVEKYFTSKRSEGLWEEVLHWFPVSTELKQIWRPCLCERCFKDRSDLFGEEYLVSIKT